MPTSTPINPVRGNSSVTNFDRECGGRERLYGAWSRTCGRNYDSGRFLDREERRKGGGAFRLTWRGTDGRLEIEEGAGGRRLLRRKKGLFFFFQFLTFCGLLLRCFFLVSFFPYFFLHFSLANDESCVSTQNWESYKVGIN